MARCLSQYERERESHAKHVGLAYEKEGGVVCLPLSSLFSRSLPLFSFSPVPKRLPRRYLLLAMRDKEECHVVWCSYRVILGVGTELRSHIYSSSWVVMYTFSLDYAARSLLERIFVRFTCGVITLLVWDIVAKSTNFDRQPLKKSVHTKMMDEWSWKL